MERLQLARGWSWSDVLMEREERAGMGVDRMVRVGVGMYKTKTQVTVVAVVGEKLGVDVGYVK